MGYIGVRRVLLPEIIKKYASAQWSVECENSTNFCESALELYNEIESYWSECELFDKEDYPDLTLESLLPEGVVELRNEYYESL